MYFGRTPRRLRSSSAFGERVHPHAVAVERDADRVDAEPGEPVERALIAVLLDDDGVAARSSTPLTRSSACSEPEVIRISSAVQAMPASRLSFCDQEFAQRPVALRAAGEAVGRERPAFARQHRVRRGDQRRRAAMLVAVVVAADEIVFRQAGEFGRRRRQAGASSGAKSKRWSWTSFPLSAKD